MAQLACRFTDFYVSHFPALVISGAKLDVEESINLGSSLVRLVDYKEEQPIYLKKEKKKKDGKELIHPYTWKGTQKSEQTVLSMGRNHRKADTREEEDLS